MSNPDGVARARMYLAAGRPSEARAILAQRLASAPDDVEALCLMAQVQLDLKQPAEARIVAQRVVGIDPDKEWGWRLLALSESACDNIYYARIAANTARRIAPQSWQTHVVLASVDTRAKRITPETRQAVDTARRLAPNLAEVHVAFGNVALADRKLLLAEASFRAALAIDPQNAVARNNLAVAALRQNRAGGAAATFVDLLSEDPGSALALRNLRAAARSALRVIHLVLVFGFVVIWMFGVAKIAQARDAVPNYGFVHPILFLVALTELVVIVILIARFRRATGRQFGTFVRSISAIDRGVTAWAVLLLLSYLVTVALLFVDPRFAIAGVYAIGLPLLVGALVARITGRRMTR